MLRTGASRLALRAIAAPSTRPAVAALARTTPAMQRTTNYSSASIKRPQLQSRVQPTSLQAAVRRRTLAGKIDREAENRYAHERRKPTPERVTTTSTIHPIIGEVGEVSSEQAQGENVMAGVKHDVDTVKQTFKMTDVPQQAFNIGLAGVLPYLATSLSTVACAYEINHSVAGYGYVLSAQTAETLLHILEPLQIGYGAVILSFLGAIHWGLEWAGYGGYQGYKRYAIGVVAPAVAWPTVLMPVEYALITQFTAFTLLYYVDTRATYRGWTPPWYAIYRFVLTFIVGASIVISLIGRGEVADRVKRLPGAVDSITALRESAQSKLAEEEAAVRVKQAAEAQAKASDGEPETDEAHEKSDKKKREGDKK